MRLVAIALVVVLAPALLVGAVSAAVAAPILAGAPRSGDADPYPLGECTWWAAYNHPVPWVADARDWLTAADRAGVTTSAVPSVGAIVVFRPGGEYSELGHVAIVTAVRPDAYRVSEMHAPELGVVREREIRWPDPAALGFIPLGIADR